MRLLRLITYLKYSAIALGLAGLGLAGVLAYYAYTLPVPHLLDPPAQPAVLLKASDGEVFAGRGVLRGRRLGADEIPRHLVDAVVAIEDRRFWSHFGIDPRGLLRAAFTNLRAGAVRQGGSTITQQLAKVMYLGPERTLSRKIQEAMIALWLEGRLEKEEILSLYLSRVYLGAGAYGVDAAAQRYFNKSAADLTLSESAMLAGLIRAPSRLAPTRDPEAARERAEIVIQAMIETRLIGEALADEARSNPAELAPAAATDPGWNYFADWSYQSVRDLLGAAQGDFTVTTTIDPRLQALAQQTIDKWFVEVGEERGFSQAALVAMAPNGAVLAMVGGRDWRDSQFNRATQARRPAGSLFKLFVYLAAFEAGLTPYSMVEDRPLRYDDWAPENYNGRYQGEMPLRNAFAKSINTVAVQLVEKTGPQQVIDIAREMGIDAPMEADLAIALGTPPVTLLEITAAYAAVAAGRARVEPHAVREVAVGNRTLYRQQAAVAAEAQRFRHRADIMDLLREVVASGTGRAAALDRPVAGKTGTSQDYRDAWFVGFTNQMIVGVWLGNDDNSPTNGVTGGAVPARMWRDFVAAAYGEVGDVVAALPEPIDEVRAPESAPLPLPAPAPEPSAAAPPPARAPATGREAPAGPVFGVPQVIDTGTLRFAARTVRLVGVDGEAGTHAREMNGYIGGREVDCVPFGRASHRCELDGYDLSEVVLFNGGARATEDAPPYLQAAEARARSDRVGIWGGR